VWDGRGLSNRAELVYVWDGRGLSNFAELVCVWGSRGLTSVSHLFVLQTRDYFRIICLALELFEIVIFQLFLVVLLD
jgi:hypothetical protein